MRGGGNHYKLDFTSCRFSGTVFWLDVMIGMVTLKKTMPVPEMLFLMYVFLGVSSGIYFTSGFLFYFVNNY